MKKAISAFTLLLLPLAAAAQTTFTVTTLADTAGIFGVRNGWRGIVIADGAATATINDNVIGNGRSGVFNWAADSCRCTTTSSA